jgi:predicted nuclease of predicted toxin-antitoxin system
MRFAAHENFPRPALDALRKAGGVEELPGISDEEIAALCSESQRVLLTFDKDFGELVFHRGVSAGSGVVLFRFIPESPEEVANAATALLQSHPDLRGTFCVITRDRIRVRPLRLTSEG